MMFYKTSSNNNHSCIFCIYWDIVHFSNIWNETTFEWLFHRKFEVHLSLSFHIAYSASHLSLQQKLTSLCQEIYLSTPRMNLHYQLLFGKMFLSPNWSILYWAIRNKCTFHYLDHLNQYNKILLYFHSRPTTHNPWRMMYTYLPLLGPIRHRFASELQSNNRYT